MKWLARAFKLVTATTITLWVYTGVVLAQDPPGPGTPAPQPDGPVVDGANIWLVLIGFLTPLVTYVINHYAPWMSTQIKGLVQGVVAALAACLYQLLSDGSFGWNEQTLVAIVTVVGSSILAHYGYAAGGLNRALGGGSNRGGAPETELQLVK